MEKRDEDEEAQSFLRLVLPPVLLLLLLLVLLQVVVSGEQFVEEDGHVAILLGRICSFCSTRIDRARSWL